MNSKALDTLRKLEEGNRRFREGRSLHHVYQPEEIKRLGAGQKPIAAIVACVDGRVTPETVFDQPLTNLFVSRVPGNVASDSAKWMLEIAVSDMHVPLVIVMAHTGCLAVGQVVNGESGAGGSLRMDVAWAVSAARSKNPADLYHASLIENALYTAENLKKDSQATRRAIAAGELDIVTALYDVYSGTVEWLDLPEDARVS